MSGQNSIDFLVAGCGMMGKIGSHIVNQAGGRVRVVLGIDNEEVTEFLDHPDVRLPDVVLAGGFDQYDGLMGCARVPFDAVYLAVPNSMHVSMGITAAKAGKHILTEKPLATSVEEAERFFAAVKEAGVAVQGNSQYRYHEVLDIALRALINGDVAREAFPDAALKEKTGGGLGKPIYIKMQYLQGWQANATDPIGWRPEVALAGPGKLVGDLGVHMLMTTYELFGGDFEVFDGQAYNLHPVRWKPRQAVESFAKIAKGPEEDPDNWEEMDMFSDAYSGDDKANATFKLRTESGLLVPGTYETSQIESGKENDACGNEFMVEIGFEEGIVRWYQPDPNHLEICDPDGSNPRRYERGSDPSMWGSPGRHPAGIGTSMLRLVHQMLTLVEEGDQAKISTYTERNVGNLVSAQKRIAQWLEKPPQPMSDYAPPEMPK